MNTMRFPRELVVQLTPAQRIELARDPMAFAAALYDFEVARKDDAELEIDAPKPASGYVEIPDWLEAEILHLSADNTILLAADLSFALLSGEWNAAQDLRTAISNRAYEWLDSQNVDVFKPLLQWVAMELL